MQPGGVDHEFLQGAFAACSFHRHLGLELEVIDAGKVCVRARHRPELEQAMGMLHGGVYAATLDTATYFAVLSHYGRTGKLPLTQEYKLNLLSSVRDEDRRLPRCDPAP